MKVALLHNHFDEQKLQAVMDEMKKLGRPTIRVYNTGCYGIYQAIEGCHRLRAAEILGVTPKFKIISENTSLSRLKNLDADFGVAEKVKELGDYENYKIEFED